ncbi:Hypothetical predicted protein [Octopus vulgaris]|uniref:Transmembrane protein n=1 Tax=Octopus vulgaris TaxID=6645 RepID=A0AA36ASX3_OCTVU|nr:Hypothetical predicted protein [Octopus vulgaris]
MNRKLRFFGHIMRRDGLERTIITGKVNVKRKRGRTPTSWLKDIAAVGLSLFSAVYGGRIQEKVYGRLTYTHSLVLRFFLSFFFPSFVVDIISVVGGGGAVVVVTVVVVVGDAAVVVVTVVVAHCTDFAANVDDIATKSNHSTKII